MPSTWLPSTPSAAPIASGLLYAKLRQAANRHPWPHCRRQKAPDHPQCHHARQESLHAGSTNITVAGSRYAHPGLGRTQPRLANEPLAVISIHNTQTAQSSSFPRRVLRPGLSVLFAPDLPEASVEKAAAPWRQTRLQQSHFTPNEGRMERRQAHSFVLSRVRGATTMTRCDRNPSRRSTVAIFGRGPAPASPAVAPDLRSGLSAAGHKARRAVSRASRGRGSRRGRGTPLPAPPSGSSPDDAPP